MRLALPWELGQRAACTDAAADTQGAGESRTWLNTLGVAVAVDWSGHGVRSVRTTEAGTIATADTRAGRWVQPTTGNANEMAQKAKTDETQAKPDAAWVDVISGSEVHREHEPTRLLRVSGLAPPGDLGVTSYWLGGLAYTAIALAAGVWLAVDWTMIDNEEPFDDTEAEERDWIAVQLPIPADPALDARALHWAMRILSELAAMDMPDGLTVKGPRAPDGPASSCGHGSRRRGRRTKETENPRRARSLCAKRRWRPGRGCLG